MPRSQQSGHSDPSPGRDGYTHVRENLAVDNPAWTLLGIRVGELGEGSAELHLPLRPQVQNPYGFIHGGILTALTDAAGGCALHTLLPYGARLATVELKVNFLRPVEADATAAAKVLHLGGKLGVCTVELRAAGAEVAAAGLLTYMVWPDGGGGDRT